MAAAVVVVVVSSHGSIHTPPLKTVLFSTLAGSPLSEEDSDAHQEEDEMSDLSVGTPNSASSSSSSKEHHTTPESNYSLKPQPLFFNETTEKGDYEANNSESQSNE